MKINCEYCQARCWIDTSKLPAAGAHVRCPSCQKIFFLGAEKINTHEESLIPEATIVTVEDEKSPLPGKLSLLSRPRPFILAVIILIGIIFLLFLATGRQPVIQSKKSSLSIPTISTRIKDQAKAEITTHSLVGDAAVSQQGNKVILTLLVDQSTPAYALKMGRQFIDTIKKLTGSSQSDKKLTTFPHYQFQLFVYYPNGNEVTEQLSNSADIRDN